MRRLTSKIVGLSALLLLSISAHATSISLTSSSDLVDVGDTVVITITADFTDNSIIGGGFDVFYNSDILDFSAFMFDDNLGDDAAFRRSPDDLDNELNGFAFGEFAGYSSQFVIGQISFVAIAQGVAVFDLAVNEGGFGPDIDGPANPGPFVTTDGQILGDGDIEFNATSVQVVPVPAAIWFMLAGLGSLGLLRKNKIN